MVIFLLTSLIFFQSGVIFGQVTTSTSPAPSTTIPPWFNPYSDGKWGNPGANIHVSNKTISAFHAHAAHKISEAIKNISLVEFNLPVGSGVLIIKPPLVSEAKFPDVESQLIKPNRIRSRLFGGRVVASGGWVYKPFGANQQPMSGGYRSTIEDGELETTTQLGRTFDAKPMVQTVDCKANLSKFRVEIQGAGNLTTVDTCDNVICMRIRAFFEDAVCQILRTFVKDTINRQLATFPARVDVLNGNYRMDYGLLNNEPKVSDYYITVGLEGKFIWRGMGSVPFNPPEISWTNKNKNRMLSFGLTDYTFNTLFQQAHSQGFRFSAADLLSSSPSTQDLLTLNCTSASTPAPRRRPGANKHADRKRGPLCLGSLLEDFSNIGQFSNNDTGDLVYKSTQKAPAVYVQSSGLSYFDGGVGNLEIYGPVVRHDGHRQLLVKLDVQMFRGEFIPKWNGANITGSIKITRLHVDKVQNQRRSMPEEWIKKFNRVVMPITLDMFNTFLNTHAQFPIPLLANIKCASPEFIISPRTMQMDCDLAQLGGTKRLIG